MALLDRIANYFKEWDGIDETAPKMELSINDLRYIADMNVERCRLIKQLNEANLKTEKLLLDKTQEIRVKAIDEFADKCKKDILCQTFGLKPINIDEIAEQMKGGKM